MNPNNGAYYSSRSSSRASENNRSNQMNPNHSAYQSSRSSFNHSGTADSDGGSSDAISKVRNDDQGHKWIERGSTFVKENKEPLIYGLIGGVLGASIASLLNKKE